ncbi:PLAC8-domain-containing protein [Eremomyces bilateralis CBS 781.70]|uniref:PLAC8-domain-containing protein n=1 Tax=Eremomyces bilateralis CBS 781.70 TaxID=1392243 RepID=A0A6G1GAY1_9PEZI|nr:PLAC8-domain-containing protein [Eremomyces bilateralis CBS 781.70]KAF1815060.1 PLAC8-domain-containing protein [Eremomyces bilateralis CBS 781.70]
MVYHHDPPPARPVAPNHHPPVRFSWQTDSSRPLTTLATRQHHVQPSSTNNMTPPSARYSYMNTPIEMQQGRPFPPAQQRPAESTIPQSPRSPDAPGGGYASTRSQTWEDAADVKKQLVSTPVEGHAAYYAPGQDQYQHPSESGYRPPEQDTQKPYPPPDDEMQKPTNPPTIPIPIPHPLFSPDSLPHPTNTPLHQPGQIPHPNLDPSASGGKQRWRHGLCECGGADVGTCVTGLLCPCVLYGKTTYRLERRGRREDPTEMLGWRWLNGRCGMMGVACGLWCLFPLFNRTRIRHLYNLEGSFGGDLVDACCCCCCVTVQSEREIRDREEKARRWEGPGQGYVPPDPMVYAPPPR